MATHKLTRNQIAFALCVISGLSRPALALSPEIFFKVDFLPAVIRNVGGRESLDIDVVLTSQSIKAIGLKFSSFVGDDRGQPITQPTQSPLFTIAHKGNQVVSRITTPADLADGFYRLHFVAAGTHGSDTTVHSAALFWQIAEGKFTLLSDEEWYAKSRSNQALQHSRTDSNR